MANKAIDGVRAKLHRANQHFEQLEIEMMADKKTGRLGFFPHDDLKSGEHIVTYHMPEDVSIRYAVLVGEVIGQIRSALEHIVWELVPSPKEGDTGFPVVWDKRDYPKKALRMISGINSSAAAIVEGLQPFNDGGNTAPLYVLNETWKRDKHRMLNFVAETGFAVVHNYGMPPEGKIHQVFHVLPDRPKLEDNTEVLRIKFPDFYHPEMKVEVECGVTLEFWDAGPATGKPVFELLRKFLEFGDRVVDALAKTI